MTTKQARKIITLIEARQILEDGAIGFEYDDDIFDSVAQASKDLITLNNQAYWLARSLCNRYGVKIPTLCEFEPTPNAIAQAVLDRNL